MTKTKTKRTHPTFVYKGATITDRRTRVSWRWRIDYPNGHYGYAPTRESAIAAVDREVKP